MNTNNKITNIIVVPEYTNNKDEISNLFHNNLNNHYKINIFDWTNLYHYADNIKFDIIKDEIIDFINNKYTNNCIIVGFGIGASIINLLDNNKYNFNKKILVSPILSKSYINPFTYDISSYKSNLNSFLWRLKKDYYQYNNFFKDKNDFFVKNKYKNYIDNLMFFDTLIIQISLYDNLKYLLKNEYKNLSNTYILSGIYDKTTSYKYIFKFAHKHHVSLKTFYNSAHNIIEEETQLFFSYLKSII